ncbi:MULTISPECIES: hypothetical protein [unclassified Moraxella]|nr:MULTISPECIES: hypothetical protein [unclassified Moraxella]
MVITVLIGIDRAKSTLNKEGVRELVFMCADVCETVIKIINQ